MDDDEYRVYFLPFPGDIDGAVRVDEDGFPSVYLNVYLAPAAARDAFDHEMRHVVRDDFHSKKGIRAVERDAG